MDLIIMCILVKMKLVMNMIFDDNENLFAHHGHFGQPHVHRCGAGHDGENHHGRRLIAKEMIQKAMLALS